MGYLDPIVLVVKSDPGPSDRMSGAIEDIAKRWLAEPSYSKVFKHTFDVIEDYLCYGLTAAGSIALAVRFLTSLGSGEVVCVIQGRYCMPWH